MKIVFATNNAHKLSEVQAVLGDAFTLLTPRDCGVEEDIPEEQQTLEGNASQKSHYLHGRTGLDCFADDTGLEVEALGGAPGVHSARYATDGHDFAANNRLLLKNLEGAENRRAVVPLPFGRARYGDVVLRRSALRCGGFGGRHGPQRLGAVQHVRFHAGRTGDGAGCRTLRNRPSGAYSGPADRNDRPGAARRGRVPLHGSLRGANFAGDG